MNNPRFHIMGLAELEHTKLLSQPGIPLVVSLGGVNDPPPAYLKADPARTYIRIEYDDYRSPEHVREHGAEGTAIVVSPRLVREFFGACRRHQIWRQTCVVYHCAQGISRSTAAAFCVEYVRPNKASRDASETLALIRRVRPIASPNPWFVSLFADVIEDKGLKKFAEEKLRP